MIAVGRYLLMLYLASRRWVAPFLLLAAGVVVLYAEPPNPVLETAGARRGSFCWRSAGARWRFSTASRTTIVRCSSPPSGVGGSCSGVSPGSAL